MPKEFLSRINIKKYLDSFLLLNLFLVILSAAYFIFSLIMEINGNSIFLNFFRKIWEPLILPMISILILSSLLIGVITWLRKKWPLEDLNI